MVACTVDTPDMDGRLRAAGIPLVPGPERAVRAYRTLVRHAESRRHVPGVTEDRARPPLPGMLALQLRTARGPLAHADARALLEVYGVPFARERIVATRREALSAAEEIGYPLVVKTARPDVLHRTEAGGVVIGVRSTEALARAVDAIEARLGPGPLLVQEEVPPGLELIVGGRRDPSFGPTVVVGLGGILAEFLRDASVGLAPLTRETARALIAEGRRSVLLRGFRGGPAVDEDALAGLLVGVGDLLTDHPAVEELDLNPLIASAGRLVAVDALVMVNPLDDE